MVNGISRPLKYANPENCSQITVPSPGRQMRAFAIILAQHGISVNSRFLPNGWNRVVSSSLAFGAVDYFAEVWVNDIKVGEHEGGYLPFELDITAAARPGANTLTVRVDDPLEIFPEIPHGKQSWYGLLSGSGNRSGWKVVQLTHIQRVKISPSVNRFGGCEL